MGNFKCDFACISYFCCVSFFVSFSYVSYIYIQFQVLLQMAVETVGDFFGAILELFIGNK